MPTLFERMSIRHQMLTLVLGITSLTLISAMLVLLVWERRSAGRDLVERAQLLARMVGWHSASAIDRGDVPRAKESLARLGSVDGVEWARLVDAQGLTLALFDRSNGANEPPDRPAPYDLMAGDHLLVAEPIEGSGGQHLGSIVLCLSTHDFNRREALYTALVGSISILLLGLSTFAAVRFQKAISRPILGLADLARRISTEGDYTLRAEIPRGDNEVVTLHREWNHMLARMEKQQREMETYRQTVQREEKRFRTIIESSPNPIFVMFAGRLVYVNPRFAQAFGHTREEILAEGFDSDCLVTPDSRSLLPSMNEKSGLSSFGEVLDQLRSGAFETEPVPPPSYEIRGSGPDGHTFDFEVNLSPVEWDQLPATMGILNNITERKIAELQREKELLHESHGALERYAEALEASNQNLRQFAYVASHDLQEPLRTTSSYIQLLARRYAGQLDADADDFIAFAVDGTRRMRNLIEDLLAYSRIDDRRPLSEVDGAEILHIADQNLRAQIVESGARIDWGPMPRITADSTQLAQLFQNLVGNAIKFRGKAPPRVRVTAERVRSGWRFAVADNGIGIEEEYLEKVFVIFQRLHDRERYQGTGIGLAICKRIVERHGGRIWVESSHGEGSTFYFTIPDSVGKSLDETAGFPLDTAWIRQGTEEVNPSWYLSETTSRTRSVYS